MVDQLAESIVKSEQRAKLKDDDPELLPTREELERQARERETFILHDEANVEIFATWWAFGGREHGISIDEAATMPASRRDDFMAILRRISEARKVADVEPLRPVSIPA